MERGGDELSASQNSSGSLGWANPATGLQNLFLPSHCRSPAEQSQKEDQEDHEKAAYRPS